VTKWFQRLFYYWYSSRNHSCRQYLR